MPSHWDYVTYATYLAHFTPNGSTPLILPSPMQLQLRSRAEAPAEMDRIIDAAYVEEDAGALMRAISDGVGAEIPSPGNATRRKSAQWRIFPPTRFGQPAAPPCENAMAEMRAEGGGKSRDMVGCPRATRVPAPTLYKSGANPSFYRIVGAAPSAPLLARAKPP